VREFWNQLLLAAHAGEPVYQPEELVPVHDDSIPVFLAVNPERRRHLPPLGQRTCPSKPILGVFDLLLALRHLLAYFLRGDALRSVPIE